MVLSPRLRQGIQSLALSLLMASITTAAVKIFGWKFWPRPEPAQKTIKKAHVPSLEDDQRLVAVTDEPSTAVPPVPSSSVAIVRRNLSATEMFALAKLAREQGNTAEALRVSRQIEEFFPNSPEGINTHLTLGMLYLAQGQAELALQEFATFRRVGDPEVKAEAYFGQAQALNKLSRLDDERTVLEELIANYPRSVYVAAARMRLNELSAAAGAR